MKSPKLSPIKQAILLYIYHAHKPASPTQIGMDFGYDIPYASRFGSYHCGGIIKKRPDVLGRTAEGHYYYKHNKRQKVEEKNEKTGA